MSSAIRKTTRLVLLVQKHPRISVRKLMEELQMSRSAVYRALGEVSKEIDLHLEDGVVRMLERQKQ